MADRPAPEPKNDLTVGKVNAIALVPAGDNPDAEIVLVKRDPRNPEAGGDSGHVGDMSTNPPAKAGAPPEGGDSADLAKYIEALEANLEAVSKQNELLQKALEEDFDDEDEDGEEPVVEKKSKKGKVAKHDPEDDDDEDGDDAGLEVEKSLDAVLKDNPVLADFVKAQRAAIDELQAKVAEADSVAKAERDARLEVEFSKRADALSALGQEKTELQKTLRAAFDECSVETYLAIEKVLAHAATVIEEGDLTTDIGKADTRDGFTSKLDEVMAKSVLNGDDGLTPEQRVVAFLSANPDEYSALNNTAAASNGRGSR